MVANKKEPFKKWLILFSAVILVLIAVSHFYNNFYALIAIGIAFAHMIVVWIYIIATSIYGAARNIKNEDSVYIKINYPDIWKKLHPWGDNSRNNFAGWMFVLGLYDDGEDSELNKIKKNMRVNTIFLTWVFGIVLVCYYNLSVIAEG